MGLAILATAMLPAAGAQLEQATRLEMDGEYAQARDAYRAFAADQPQHRLAPLAVMAQANIELLAFDDHGAAITAYDHLVRDYPQSEWAAEAARRKAELLEAGEAWQQAGQAYGVALELAGRQPNGPGAEWVNEVSLATADCFYQAGEHGAVIETYEAVLQNPLPAESAATITYRLADCLETSGHPELAAARYAELIRTYPGMSSARDALAKRELLDQHESIDWEPYLALAEAREAVRRRDFAGALEQYRLARDGTEDPAVRRCADYGTINVETSLGGDYTQGLERLERFVDELSDPTQFPNSTRLAQQYRMIAEGERRAREHPDDAAALSSLGMQYVQARASEKAIEVLERARSLDPEDGDVHLGLGYAYQGAGRGEEAQQAFTAYLEHDPHNTQVLNMIGYTCLGGGDTEAAIGYFQRYAEVAPDDPNAHDSLGEGYLRAGRLEDAAREYERAVELDDSFANSYFMLGEVYRQLDAPEKAVAAYRRFVTLVASGPQADQARAALEELGQEP
ncbi:MAG: tetratricopeptide repeat protein [Candidatus Eisenbacteria sp.]|nr:tetratricopeptide repeat protein [Candidatus Eisenbacteria bacterium]